MSVYEHIPTATSFCEKKNEVKMQSILTEFTVHLKLSNSLSLHKMTGKSYENQSRLKSIIFLCNTFQRAVNSFGQKPLLIGNTEPLATHPN